MQNQLLPWQMFRDLTSRERQALHSAGATHSPGWDHRPPSPSTTCMASRQEVGGQKSSLEQEPDCRHQWAEVQRTRDSGGLEAPSLKSIYGLWVVKSQAQTRQLIWSWCYNNLQEVKQKQQNINTDNTVNKHPSVFTQYEIKYNITYRHSGTPCGGTVDRCWGLMCPRSWWSL